MKFKIWNHGELWHETENFFDAEKAISTLMACVLSEENDMIITVITKPKEAKV